MQNILPCLVGEKYPKGTTVSVSCGSLGYDQYSLLSATRIITFDQEKTLGSLLVFRPDGLMAFIDFRPIGRFWVSSHKLTFL